MTSPVLPHVVLDANVLLHVYLRDLLLTDALLRRWRVRWTDPILAEVRRTIVGKGWMGEEAVAALLAAMRRTFPRAAITGYESLEGKMTNDPKDRHVAAAAAFVGADIVTFNLRHFRPRDLAPHGIIAIHPDAFLVRLHAHAPASLAASIRAQATQRRHPPLTADAYLDKLAGPVPDFARAMRATLRERNGPNRSGANRQEGEKG